MPRSATRFVVVLTLTAISLAAQDGPLDGPVTGVLMHEQSRSIRPIIGMPGSAYAGGAAVQSFDFAAVAPDSRSAVITRDGALFLIRRLDAAKPVWREMTSQAPAVTSAAWSEDSGAVALWNASGSSLDLWTGLSSEPRLAGTIDVSALAGEIAALAVDSQARWAFASVQGESSAMLYLLKPGSDPLPLIPLVRAGSLLLAGDILFATDRGLNQVMRVTSWDSTPEITAVATSGHGVNDPVGAALSRDGRLLFIASAGSRQVLAVDLASGAVTSSIDLDFLPTRLERLGSGSLFLLEKGTPGEAPAQILDSATQHVFFVPVSVAVATE